MGSYLCKKCKVWHTDIASPTCPVLRAERIEKYRCAECGHFLGKKVMATFDDCPECECDIGTALDHYFREMVKDHENLTKEEQINHLKVKYYTKDND